MSSVTPSVSRAMSWGTKGSLEIFAFTRRLGHRIGLSTWAGPCGTSSDFDELVAALDTLDGAAAFVDPAAMAEVTATDYAEERSAMATVVAIIGAAIVERDADPSAPDDHFQRMMAPWDGAEDRIIGIALDVILVHLGSMSNLFAALGWLLVDVTGRSVLSGAIAAGDHGLAERCALESIRLAQRSIMLRTVLNPIEVDDGTCTYRVQPGVTLATLLPLTNTSSADLETYDPDRWIRRRIRDERGGPVRELVTTFGHGAHTCPAQPFSLSVMTTVLERMLARYDLVPAFANPRRRLVQPRLLGTALARWLGAGDPVAVEAVGDPDREVNGRDRRGGEVLGVDDDHIGRVALRVVGIGHDPTFVLGRIRAPRSTSSARPSRNGAPATPRPLPLSCLSPCLAWRTSMSKRLTT